MQKLILFAVSLAGSSALAGSQSDPATLVNPFLGSGGNPLSSGNTFPGATTPFGYIRLSPDTRYAPGLFAVMPGTNNAGKSGYFWGHTRLTGFSHTRLQGAGVREGGFFRVLPLRAREVKDPSRRTRETAFRHEQEVATPGYYGLTIPHEGLKAELTASPRCGFHRYTPLKADSAIDIWVQSDSKISKHGKPMSGALTLHPERNAVSGETEMKSDVAMHYGGLVAYFYAEFTPGTDAALFEERSWVNGLDAQGKESGFRLTARGKTIELKLCISHVSRENARLNFEHEARGQTFESVRDQARALWNERLSVIQIQGLSETDERIFYTSLYNTMLMPSLFTDANGEYLGFKRTPGRATDFTYRTDFSLWDTFRVTHPLYSLIQPELQRDSLRSMMAMGEIDGRLPLLAFGGGDTKMMFGAPASLVLSEAYLKGHRDFNAHRALDLMIHEFQTRECAPYGFCPADKVRKGSVSKTLEYAWTDSAVARFARAIGREADALQFDRGAQAFLSVWDPSTKFFRPRTTQGTWFDFTPDVNSFFFGSIHPGGLHYIEGSARQWRYSVPHEPKKLAALMGGDRAFVASLEDFMQKASVQRGAVYMGGHYWHGNEHDLHAIYLFNEAGRPDLTQKWARWALRTRYANTPGGLDGNDDAGTLTAWYVFSALGLYPQAGSDRYWLGSPAVASAKLTLSDGSTLEILAKDAHPKNIYVQKVSLNGVRLCEPVLTHRELSGAKLEFEMGATAAPHGGYCASTP